MPPSLLARRLLCDLARLGPAVRDWRARAGLTQRQVATRLGITEVWLSQLETGKRLPAVALVRSIEERLR